MRKQLAVLAVFASALTPSVAYADAICYGLTNNAITYATGDVMVLPAWRGDWIVICNVNTPRNNVSPSTCFSWFSAINNSILYNKPVGYYFAGIDQSACATLPTYSSAPTPVYVSLNK
jgi:hypothetical protein